MPATKKLERFHLVGKTKKGKQIVKEHGSIWDCQKLSMTVGFSPDFGPWALVGHDGAMRWIHLTFDGDFEVSRILSDGTHSKDMR